LKLKLFSEEEVLKSRVERLRTLMGLGTQQLSIILADMIKAVHGEEETDYEELGRQVGIDGKLLRRCLPVFSMMVLRILSGRGGQDVQQDLVEHGFAEEKVRFLFSRVNEISQDEKDKIRHWALEAETASDRNHLHAFSTQTDTRSIVDNGYMVGMLPISVIVFRICEKDRKEERVVRFEIGRSELDLLIKAFDYARQELETVTKGLKNRLGDSMATTGM